MRKEFDPAENFEQITDEMAVMMSDLSAKLARLEWLRLKMAERIAQAETDAARFETFTEAEAGLLFKLHADAEKAGRAMADLRRLHDLPHIRLGREVRYTREHLREITALLEMNAKSRKAEHRPHRLKAA